MNELVSIKGNEIFTDSLVISEGTDNKHQNVKEMIKKYEKDLLEFGTLHVLNVESTGGRPEQYYQLNEEQATFLITLLRNNKIVVKFKKELVREFYSMRKFILEKQSKEWIATRYQGSEHANKLYITYSKLANKIAGIKKRDQATISQLNNLSLIENIILYVIDAGIMSDLYYKEIYQDCKKRLEIFKDIAYLS